jgi:hypothetical protein
MRAPAVNQSNLPSGVENPELGRKIGQSNRLSSMIFLSIFALAVGGLDMRFCTDGPNLSVIGDIIPFTAAVTAIHLSLLALRSGVIVPAMVSIPCICLSTVAIGLVIIDVYTFWCRFGLSDVIGI